MASKRARLTQVPLSALRAEALNAEDSPDLDPEQYAQDLPPIIIEYSAGPLTIVDGYHRAAGMVNWAIGAGLKLNSVVVEVIDATRCDEDLVAAAAVPEGGYGMSQEDAIEEIEDQAFG